MSHYRVGVDIGGTFADIVLLDAEGRLHTKKVASSVDDTRVPSSRGWTKCSVSGD